MVDQGSLPSHVVVGEGLWGEHSKAGLGQDDRRRPETEPADEDPGSNEAIATNTEKAFAFAAKAPASLVQDANLDSTMKHPYFGPLNCYQWAAFSIMHTDIHTRQIQRIKGSDAYP